jgi:hypothetical protein
MLKPLKIHSKHYLPQVILDKENAIFSIKGKSIPEDSNEFYSRVMSWLKDYFDDPNDETIFTFELEYYNSASAREIANLIKFLQDKYDEGHKIRVKWFFIEEDEVMKENGEDFSILFSLPIEIQPKN